MFMGLPPTIRSSPFKRDLGIGGGIAEPEIYHHYLSTDGFPLSIP